VSRYRADAAGRDDPPAPVRPLLVDQVEPGCDSYVVPGQLPNTNLRRRWLFYGRVRSVEHRAGGVVKERHKFTDHLEESAFRGFLAECEARGVRRPSSYGDCFHQRHRIPWHPPYSRKMFPAVPGAWQATLGTKVRFTEPLYQYDMKSAYLWSLAQGLPDPATFRRVKRFDGPGVYWAESPAQLGLPYPWCWPGFFPASDHEITTLHLENQVTVGTAFAPATFDVRPLVSDIQAWQQWKAIARSYWGRWASHGSVECQTLDHDGAIKTARHLPDPCRAPVWAILITSRVRMKLWALCWEQPIHRVFVDSVVTTARLPTGDQVGDWVEKDFFPAGGIVTIHGVRRLAA